MNIAPINVINIKLPERRAGESPREYVSRCGIDPIHTDIIFSIYEELRMKSFEQAVAHAMAMFSAIQDLFYYNEPEISLPPFLITVKESSYSRRYRDRYRKLDLNSKRYITTRRILVTDSHENLLLIKNKYESAPELIEKAMLHGFTTKKELTKKVRNINKWNKKAIITQSISRKKKNKCRKNNGFYKMKEFM